MISVSSSHSASGFYSSLIFLMMSLLVTSSGVAQADDFEKIVKRIEKMAEKGKVDPDSAERVIDLIAGLIDEEEEENEWTEDEVRHDEARHRERRDRGEHRDRDEHRERAMIEMRQKELEIREAVENGKLTEENAHLVMESLHNRFKEQEHARSDHREEEMHRQIKRIMRAAESGEIGMKAAESRIKKMKVGFLKTEYRKFEGEIAEAVEAGKISKREAEAKLIEMRKRMFGEFEEKPVDEREIMAKLKDFSSKVEQAIEDGVLTHEEGRKKLMQLRKKMAIMQQEHESHDRDDEGHHEHGDDHNHEDRS